MPDGRISPPQEASFATQMMNFSRASGSVAQIRRGIHLVKPVW